MLDFQPDEEQKMVVQTIKRFADSRMRKVFRDAEEDATVPIDIIQEGWEFGLFATSIPEEYGGFGEYSVVTNALAVEELARGDLALALNILAPGSAAIPLMLYGTDRQKEVHLPQFCGNQPPPISTAFSEPVLQFDPYSMSTTAVLQNGEYLLSGTKWLVPHASDAKTFIVYAREASKTQAFIVPSSTEGLKIVERDKLMGIRAFPTYKIELEDCAITAENKVGGEEGINFELLLNHNRAAGCAAAVGLARAAYEYAREYAKTRIQFGEPIAHRQSIAFMLAEMAIDVDAARLMVWEVAWMLENGKSATKEAVTTKFFTDQMVLRVADQAVQILGGYGYIREYPVELWLRNARGFPAFDGIVTI